MKKSTLSILFLLLGVFSNGFAQSTFPGSKISDSYAERRIKDGVFEITDSNLSKNLESTALRPLIKAEGRAIKNVVLEESTGTWCQWCPKGTYFSDSISLNYDNVFVIAVHGYDQMENTEHIEGSGLVAFPSANIDRSYTKQNINQWFSAVDDALQEEAVAELSVSNNFDLASRLLSVTVTADFVQDVSGDYRLAAIILEDGVTGPSPAYNQANQYSGGTNGFAGGYEILPSPIPAHMIAYNHVSRMLLGGYEGAENSLPSSIASGSTHGFNFEYTIAETWDADLVYVLAVLLTPEGKIDNAAKSLYLNGANNAKPIFMSSPLSVAYVGNEYVYTIYSHDPDNPNLQIEADILPDWLSISQTTSVGHIHDKAVLSGTANTPGIYEVVLSVSDGINRVEQAFTIEVEGASEGEWTLIGEAGFTTGGAYNQGFAVADDGSLYLISVSNSIMEVYKKEEGSEWTALGLNQADASSGQVAVAPDGTPYIAYSHNWSSVYIKKYENGEWIQVGDSPTDGNQIGMLVSSQGEPVIALQDASHNYQGNAYKYNGTSWELLGGGVYSTIGDGAAWNVIREDNNGSIYVLWGAFGSSGTAAYVSKLTDNGWVIMGEQAVGEANVYYYQSFDLDNNGNIYVAYPATASDKKLEVYHFDGTNWSLIGDDLTAGAVESCGVRVADDGTVYVSFLDFGYSNTISTMSYNGSEWSYVGPRGFSNTEGKFPLIVVHHNTPIVAYSDFSLEEKATVKAYLVQEFATIHIVPEAIDFGITPLDQPLEAEILITNLGNIELVISEIHSSSEVFVPSSTSLTIDAGKSETILLTFAPTEEKLYEGFISFYSNDATNPVVEVEVSGTGITIIGLDEQTANTAVIYPNPTKGDVYISGIEGLKQVYITNSSGQTVLKAESSEQIMHFSIKNLSSGVYFIHIGSEDYQTTKKLIIK